MSKSKNELTVDAVVEEKPKKKWPLLVVAIFLSLSAIVGGLALSMGTDAALELVLGGDDESSEVTTDDMNAEKETTDGEEHASNATLTVNPFKEIIVNITSVTETGRKRSRFLKLNLALVFDETAEGASHVEERKIYIRDAFQNYLRQLTERDLSGTIGVVRLKSELLRRARAVAESDAPKEVLISDIIVQ